jgi:hypothetical protein
MKLTRVSKYSGKTHSIEINLTEAEYIKAHKEWMDGRLIQNAFPTLNADEREFIKTGITRKEWRELFDVRGD